MLKLKIVLFTAFFFTLSPSLYAEADGPDYWRVQNVEKNDVLNMRSYADFKAPVLGKIPHDAQCIKNMGCKGGLSYEEFTTLSDTEKRQILKQRPRWCRVNFQGKTAWVAGRYLAEAPCPVAKEKKRLLSTQGVDPYNHGYAVENERVALRNGYARKTIPGTTAVIITEIVNIPVYADLNNDGFEEAVLILMQHTGGTGTFYYLAIAPGASKHERFIASYFLGDRIKIKSLSAENNIISVDYFDRDKNQAMSARPTLTITKQFKFIDGRLVVNDN